MLSSIFVELSSNCRHATQRSEGVAFLKASATLYGLGSLCYLALNIANGRDASVHYHGIYSDRTVIQKVSRGAIGVDRLEKLGLLDTDPVDWSTCSTLQAEIAVAARAINQPEGTLRLLTLVIPTTRNETALLGVAASLPDDEWSDFKSAVVHDLRVLATYFHNHVLRLHGIDAAAEILISARELDCLKWTAAGKTAWEASRILGISERTVRFHLNSAREKLNCANTTQAVAIAVSQRMISV